MDLTCPSCGRKSAMRKTGNGDWFCRWSIQKYHGKYMCDNVNGKAGGDDKTSAKPTTNQPKKTAAKKSAK